MAAAAPSAQLSPVPPEGTPCHAQAKTPTNGPRDVSFPVSPCSNRMASPSAGSAAKEIRDRLRLLQRTLADSIGPTYHVPSTRDAAEKKKLLSMMKSLERADKRREISIERHRKQVLQKQQDMEEKRQQELMASQQRKHDEHAKQLTVQRCEVTQTLKDNSQRWWTKHENSKLKLHNDMLKERGNAREQSVKRDEKIQTIQERKSVELRHREAQSEGKRRAAQDRVERLHRENKLKEEQRDLDRELRKIHWDKRVAAVERERQARMKRVELSRKEALQRNTESTAFESAASVCQKREKIREARLTELELRRKEEREMREVRNRSRFNRVDDHKVEALCSMQQDYQEIERRHIDKERHLQDLRRKQAEYSRLRQQHTDEMIRVHREGHKRALEKKTAGIEERWGRRAERCFKYFIGEETQHLINSFKGD